jgi:hypothetical protein
MPRNDAPPAFRYRQGQRVRWAGFPFAPFLSSGRRWTERTILGPVPEYRLDFVVTGADMPGWVSEDDLCLWPEEDRP